MKTVLVADDRDSSRELIRTILQLSRFSVIEATNGAEAIFLVHDKRPDLVVLDLHMPIRDGFEVLRELRSDPPFQSIPVIALTSSADHGGRERALDCGFSSYLTKPLNLAAFRKEVSRLLPT